MVYTMQVARNNLELSTSLVDPIEEEGGGGGGGYRPSAAHSHTAQNLLNFMQFLGIFKWLAPLLRKVRTHCGISIVLIKHLCTVAFRICHIFQALRLSIKQHAIFL